MNLDKVLQSFSGTVVLDNNIADLSGNIAQYFFQDREIMHHAVIAQQPNLDVVNIFLLCAIFLGLILVSHEQVLHSKRGAK